MIKTMTTEDYISFEIAKLLKEKGFRELCHCNYHCDGFFYQHKEKDYNGKNYEKLDSEWYSAPTLQMAMKWLREEYNIHIEIHYLHESKDYSYVIDYVSIGGVMCVNGFNSYENAVEAAILECLTNLI